MDWQCTHGPGNLRFWYRLCYCCLALYYLNQMHRQRCLLAEASRLQLSPKKKARYFASVRGVGCVERSPLSIIQVHLMVCNCWVSTMDRKPQYPPHCLAAWYVSANLVIYIFMVIMDIQNHLAESTYCQFPSLEYRSKGYKEITIISGSSLIEWIFMQICAGVLQ